MADRAASDRDSLATASDELAHVESGIGITRCTTRQSRLPSVIARMHQIEDIPIRISSLDIRIMTKLRFAKPIWSSKQQADASASLI